MRAVRVQAGQWVGFGGLRRRDQALLWCKRALRRLSHR